MFCRRARGPGVQEQSAEHPGSPPFPPFPIAELVSLLQGVEGPRGPPGTRVSVPFPMGSEWGTHALCGSC